MEEKNKVAIERRSNETDYFIVITNVGVVIILLLCLFIYFVFEYKLEIIDLVCPNINLFFERAKLLLILLLSCLWLMPIIYKNHQQSKVYLIADLTKYIISMLFIPFYIAYITMCT